LDNRSAPDQRLILKKITVLTLITLLWFSPLILYYIYKAFTPPPIGFDDVRFLVLGERGGRIVVVHGPMQPGQEPQAVYTILRDGQAKHFSDEVEVMLPATLFQQVRAFQSAWCWNMPQYPAPVRGQDYYVIAMDCWRFAKQNVVPAEALPTVLREVQQQLDP
jgi:hypothetical protein